MKKFIAIDFDHTIAYHRGGREVLFRILRKNGIPLRKIGEIYERTKKEHGLSAEGLFRVAQEYVTEPLNKEAIARDVVLWLHSSVTCYPEAAKAMAMWKAANIPIYIVTVGTPEFQKKKVEIANVPHDDIFVLDTVNNKSGVLKQLLARYGAPCIFIDDKATELDAIRESGLNREDVATFRIRRKNSPYYTQVPVFPHIEIATLDDISPISDLFPYVQ